MQKQYLEDFYNDVNNLIAVYRPNKKDKKRYPHLVEGKSYQVTYIGGTSISPYATTIKISRIFLEDHMPDSTRQTIESIEYDILDFEIYEDEINPYRVINKEDPRFMSPCSRSYYMEHNYNWYKNAIEQITIPALIQHIEYIYHIDVVLAVEMGERVRGLHVSDWNVQFYYFEVSSQEEHSRLWYEHGDIKFHGISWDLGIDSFEKGDLSIYELFLSRRKYAEKTQSSIPGSECLDRIYEKIYTKEMSFRYYFDHYVLRHAGALYDRYNYKREAMYCLIGILNCYWIEYRDILPPMDIQELLDGVKEHIQPEELTLIENYISIYCPIDITGFRPDRPLLDILKKEIQYWEERIENPE